MAARDDRVYIHEALDAIERAVAFLGDLSLEGFLGDEKTQSAVIRQIEIIGEACGRVGRPLREEHPQIPWSQTSTHGTEAGLQGVVHGSVGGAGWASVFQGESERVAGAVGCVWLVGIEPANDGVHPAQC